jgi:adenine/guanine phosphoribosyltransferase-like PRPP-binding protein
MLRATTVLLHEKDKVIQHTIMSDYLTQLLEPETLREILKTAKTALSNQDYDAIAFRGVSGALLASPLSIMVNKPLIVVRKPGESAHSKASCEGCVTAKRYIIVDDFVATGGTCRAIIKAIKVFSPDAQFVGVLEAQNLSVPTNKKLVKLLKHTPTFSMLTFTKGF